MFFPGDDPACDGDKDIESHDVYRLLEVELWLPFAISKTFESSCFLR